MVRPYLEGVRVRTEHSALKWILELPESAGRLMRWRLRLMEFEFYVIHRSRRAHQAPDSLARLPTDSSDTAEIDDALQVFSVHDTVYTGDPTD